MALDSESQFSEVDLAAARRIFQRVDGRLIVESVSVLGEGIKSDVYLATCSDGSKFVLKVFKHEYDWCAETEAAFYDELQRARPEGIDGLPRRVASFDDHTVLARRVTVLTYAPGNPMEDRFGFGGVDQRSAYRALGATLSELHRIEQPEFGIHPLDERGGQRSNREYMTGLWANSLNHFFEDGGNRYLGWEIRRYLLSREHLWDECTSPRLCHGDPHPGNVLVEVGEQGLEFRRLIDFEMAMAGDPLFDLADAYYNSEGDRESKLAAMLDGYGEVPGYSEERFKMYVLYFALGRWTFLSSYGARPPLRGIAKEMARIVGASRWRIFRSALRARLTSG